jgi:tape measure domain-containing protein
VADWNVGGLGEEEIITVRATLVGAGEVAAEAAKVDTALESMGTAAETTGKKMEVMSRRSFLMQQAMFTLRRYLFYGTQALLAGGAAAVYFGLKFDSNMQQSTVALTQFLGSSAAAKKELDLLYHLAAYTPFQFQDVTEAAKAMLSFGFSTKETNTDLRVMADTMSALGLTGPSVQQLTNDIVKMAARGKVMGQDIREFVSLHIPALKILQEQLGLTQTQIESIGEAGIPASIAIPALMRGLEQRYHGMAALQQKTLAGQISTLKDLTQQTLGVMEKPLFDWIQNVALPIANTIAGALQKGFGHGGFLGTLKELNRSNAPFWFKTLYTFIVRTVETVQTLYNAFKPLIYLLAVSLLAALYLINVALGIFNRHTRIGTALVWLLVYAYVAYNFQTWLAIIRTAILRGQFLLWLAVMAVYEAAVWGIVAATTAWNIVTDLVTAAMVALDVVLWANPIGLIVLAVLAAVAALGLLYWKSKTFRDLVDNSVMPGVLGFFALLIRLIMGAAHALDVLHGKWSFLPDASGLVGGIGRGLLTAIPGVGPALGIGELYSHFAGGGGGGPSKPHVKSHNIPDRSQMLNLGTKQHPIEIRVPITLDRKTLGEAVAHYNQDVQARR